jgi:selenoprotein W-related protein
MAELLHSFEPEIESITLIPSDGGRFEVSVNNELIYSKLQTLRHAEPGEVNGLIRQILMEKIHAY